MVIRIFMMVGKNMLNRKERFIMKEKLAKLINVKSIVTILLTFVVAYKAIMGQMDIEQIYLMIIAFYFGTQLEKNNKEE